MMSCWMAYASVCETSQLLVGTVRIVVDFTIILKSMKFRVFILLLLGALPAICHAQIGVNRCNYLNVVFVVDREITDVFGGEIIAIDSARELNDTIRFKNDYIGTIIFDDSDYTRFNSLDPLHDVLVRFWYVGPAPEYRRYQYEERIQAKWLNYGFIIFRVYNYDNKINWKEFPQRKGYGIEWQASERSKIIPRRAR